MSVLRDALIFAGGAAAGAGVAFVVLKKRYEQSTQEQVDEVKAYYERLYTNDGERDELDEKYDLLEQEAVEDEPVVGDSPTLREIQEAFERNRTLAQPYGQEALEETHQYMLDSTEPFEPENRAPNTVYMISLDEYMLAEDAFDQVTVTYYEVDGVIADEQDVDLGVDYVGAHNLQRWDDPAVVEAAQDRHQMYVRNERLRTNIEIVREQSSYAQMMAARDAEENTELRHSASYRPRFRDGRDD